MEMLWVFLLVALEVIAIVDAMRAYLPPMKKCLWILLILLVPVLGIFLYYLLGRPDRPQQA